MQHSKEFRRDTALPKKLAQLNDSPGPRSRLSHIFVSSRGISLCGWFFSFLKHTIPSLREKIRSFVA